MDITTVYEVSVSDYDVKVNEVVMPTEYLKFYADKYSTKKEAYEKCLEMVTESMVKRTKQINTLTKEIEKLQSMADYITKEHLA